MPRCLSHHEKQKLRIVSSKTWYSGVIRTNLDLAEKVTRAIKGRFAKVADYFSLSITNVVAEGINYSGHPAKSTGLSKPLKF